MAQPAGAAAAAAGAAAAPLQQTAALAPRGAYLPVPQQPVFLDLSQARAAASGVLNKPVITRTSGRALGTLCACWIDPGRREVVSFDLDDRKSGAGGASGLPLVGGAARAGNLPLPALRQIGDVVLVHDEAGLYEPDLDGRLGFVNPVGLEVRTAAGDFLGKVRDISFSPDSGALGRLAYDEFGLPSLPSAFFDCYSVGADDILSVGRSEVIVYDDARYRERKESSGLFAAIPSLLKSLGPGGRGGGGGQLALPAAGMSDAYRDGGAPGGGTGRASYLPSNYSYDQWQQDLRRWEAETGMTYEQYLRASGGAPGGGGGGPAGGPRAALPPARGAGGGGGSGAGYYAQRPAPGVAAQQQPQQQQQPGAYGARPGAGAAPYGAAAGGRPRYAPQPAAAGAGAPQQQQPQQQPPRGGYGAAPAAGGAGYGQAAPRQAPQQQPAAGGYGAPQQGWGADPRQRPGASSPYGAPPQQQAPGQQQRPASQQQPGYGYVPQPQQPQQPAGAWQQPPTGQPPQPQQQPQQQWVGAAAAPRAAPPGAAPGSPPAAARPAAAPAAAPAAPAAGGEAPGGGSRPVEEWIDRDARPRVQDVLADGALPAGGGAAAAGGGGGAAPA
ncbi:MAG: hypothetical protein J3K34DRAFT_463259 [Monoraphidium minutum]|nr:MAG: hypothetical protein J3K34DRAFT_463259 [Monoraphidium minutum]